MLCVHRGQHWWWKEGIRSESVSGRLHEYHQRGWHRQMLFAPILLLFWIHVRHVCKSYSAFMRCSFHRIWVIQRYVISSPDVGKIWRIELLDNAIKGAGLGARQVNLPYFVDHDHDHEIIMVAFRGLASLHSIINIMLHLLQTQCAWASICHI